MGHWIDSLARALAASPLSRRSVVAGSLRAGLAASAAGLLAGEAPPARASEARPAQQPRAARNRCQVQDDHGVLSLVWETGFNSGKLALSLSHSFSAEVASGASSATTVVSSSSGELLRLQVSSAADGSGRATLRFGSAYSGAERADFVLDGKSIQGSVDGRATEPLALGAPLSQLRFKDGKPAPVVQVAAELERAVAALLARAARQRGACKVQGSRKALGDTAACASCQLACWQRWARCGLGQLAASLGAGALAATQYLSATRGPCDDALQACYTDCKVPGRCCPDHCQGDRDCCQTAWGCCPPPKQGSWSKRWPTCPRCAPEVQRGRPARRGQAQQAD